MLIRFLQRDAPYEAGQEVDEPEASADKLIHNGVAVGVVPEGGALIRTHAGEGVMVQPRRKGKK